MDCSREGCSRSASCYQTVGHGLSADGLSRAQMPVMWDGQDPRGMQRLRAEEGAPAAWGWRECRGWRTVSPYPRVDATHSHTHAPQTHACCYHHTPRHRHIHVHKPTGTSISPSTHSQPTYLHTCLHTHSRFTMQGMSAQKEGPDAPEIALSLLFHPAPPWPFFSTSAMFPNPKPPPGICWKS